jgi:predicted nucleotidyltransferase
MPIGLPYDCRAMPQSVSWFPGPKVAAMATQSPPVASEVLNILRARQPALRQAGITHLSLFGSVARNEAGPDSDIDLAAEFDPAAKMDLIRLVEIEYELSDLLGREVQILPEPIHKPRLRENVERDRIRAF